MLRRGLIFIVSGAFLLMLSSCSEPHSERWSKCERAYERALASIESDRTIEVDVIWLLQKLEERYSDRRVAAIIESWIAQRLDHPYLLMVKPDAARLELPVDPGTGIDKYFYYVQAALGYPENRAAAFVESFVREPDSGYILTHQLAALVWSEENGLKLGLNVLEKKRAIIDKIQSEHRAQGHSVSVDLFAERTALLLVYGEPTFDQATEWVGKLVNAQSDSGEWPASKSVLEYDGEFASASVPPSHTTALAMLAIRAYMFDYLEN